MGDATLELVSYTDPYCTWCWGSEPMLRRLDQVYGGAVRLRFVMGGLVKDISDFYDAANDIGGPEFYKQVAKHWLEASERHGMPVYDRIWYEMADEFRSTYPASLAYKAAQLENGRKADRFLRKMREGAAALGKMIHRSDVQLEMAGAVGLDGRMLKGNLESGAAEREFRKDLADAVERGARGFPTFLFRSRTDEVLVRGYRPSSQFDEVIGQLEPGLSPEHLHYDADSVSRLFGEYETLAPREIAEIFGVTAEARAVVLEELTDRGDLVSEVAGNGILYRMK